MSAYRVGEWTVRPDLNQMTCGEKVVTLEPRILALLNCFADHPDRVLNRDDLIEKAWDGVIVSDSTINHTVGVLRRVLGDKARAPQYIQTVAKKGYRLVAAVEALPDIPISDGSNARLASSPNHPNYLWPIAVALVFVAAVTVHFTPSQQDNSNAFLFTESKPLTTLQGQEHSPEIDPTGEWLYFSYTEKHEHFADLYRQPIAGGLPELVFAATADAHETSPAISPEGDRIAYARFNNDGCTVMLRHLTTDKPAENLADCGPYAPRIDWTPGGDILFAASSGRKTPARIKRIHVDSGKVGEITDADYGVGDYTYALSHDGTRIAFLRTTHWNHSDLIMKNLETGDETLLRQFPTWFFDVTWAADDHTILYTPEPSQRQLEAYDVNTGTVSAVYTQAKGLFGYRGLKDANKLLATERSWDTNIYSAPLRSGVDALRSLEASPLVASTRSDWQPRVTLNGRILAFLSDRTGDQEIWASDPRGRNARQLSHLAGDIQVHIFEWDHSGQFITFDGYDDRVYLLDIETGSHKPLTPKGMTARNPAFSPDGKQIIFTSDDSGEWQIWQISVEGGAPSPLTKRGGFSARYGADSELYVTKYYKDGLWQVDAATGDEILVVPNMITGPMQQWSLRHDGVYYLNNQIGRAQIFYYSWETKKSELLHDMPHLGFTFELSADGQNILFTRDDSRASDIVMIE